MNTQLLQPENKIQERHLAKVKELYSRDVINYNTFQTVLGIISHSHYNNECQTIIKNAYPRIAMYLK